MADKKLANVYNSDEELQQQILEEGGGGGGGDVNKEYVDRMDAEERQRAMAKENQLNEKIDNEITRATTEENNIKNEKQDKLTEGSDLSSVSDTTKISIVDLATKIITNFTLATLWNWIKGKITELYFPVGIVIFNTGTNPRDNYGGTWQLYATGTKALYLDATAGTSVSEELPNIKGNVNWIGGGQAKTEVSNATGAFYKSNTPTSGQEYPIGTGASTGARGFSFEASRSNAIYKDNGHVKVEGITICAWKRTA